ncbi:MAG: hypothetical protein NE334_16285 [Lentisphaeraceae bacterium]|nr:hypothetical protein [Lentisphaeraceae bacterium]
MNFKIVKYNIDDLVVDLKEMSQNLTTTCSSRATKWQVTGVCQKNDIVIIALNQVDSLKEDYFFADVRAGSVEDIEQEIRAHWQSGIYLLGIININEDENIALYRREK